MEATTKKMSPKTLWTIAIVAIVIAMVWYNREKIKKMLGMGSDSKDTTKETTKETNSSTNNSNSTTTTTTGLDYDKIIKLTNPTMKGKEEKLLQQMLNQEMVYRKAKPVTPPLINEAHNDVPLVTDGIVGDKTINLLFKYTGMREGSLNTIKAKLNTMVTIPSVSSLWGG